MKIRKNNNNIQMTKTFPEMNMKTENVKILFNSKEEHKL